MKNYSKQREEIINTIKNLYNHPTAEDIYIFIKSKDPFVSRSTVYRNLGLLVENGIVEKISVPDRPDKYDYVRQVHNHVICTSCGKAFDFKYNFEYKKIKNQIKKQNEVELHDKGIVLEGTCSDCKKN